MKKFILSLLLFIISTIVYSQSNTDREITIINSSSEIITIYMGEVPLKNGGYDWDYANIKYVEHNTKFLLPIILKPTERINVTLPELNNNFHYTLSVESIESNSKYCAAINPYKLFKFISIIDNESDEFYNRYRFKFELEIE